MTQEILKTYRLENGISQKEAAKICAIPLRTYQNYENDFNKINTFKYEYLIKKLKEYFKIDEEHGILSIESIKNKVANVLKNYNVNYCYLFGSYAKGNANEKSDVDLLIDNNVQGIHFYGLVELLRESLNKKVDLLDARQLTANPELMDNVLKDGIRIYGK